MFSRSICQEKTVGGIHSEVTDPADRAAAPCNVSRLLLSDSPLSFSLPLPLSLSSLTRYWAGRIGRSARSPPFPLPTESTRPPPEPSDQPVRRPGQQEEQQRLSKKGSKKGRGMFSRRVRLRRNSGAPPHNGATDCSRCSDVPKTATASLSI